MKLAGMGTVLLVAVVLLGACVPTGRRDGESAAATQTALQGTITAQQLQGTITAQQLEIERSKNAGQAAQSAPPPAAQQPAAAAPAPKPAVAQPPAPAPTSAQGCPSSTQEAALMYGGDASDWTDIGVDPGKGKQWKFKTTNPTTVLKNLNAPRGNAYYDFWKFPGEQVKRAIPDAGEATLNCGR